MTGNKGEYHAKDDFKDILYLLLPGCPVCCIIPATTTVVYTRTVHEYYDNGNWKIGDTRLYRSTESGGAGSWEQIFVDSAFMAFGSDPRQGKIYASRENKLLVSSNQCNEFDSLETFCNRITGIYVPDKQTSVLYVSTTTDIWKLEEGTRVETLKHVMVGVKDRKKTIPSNIHLKQNYPNPFNPTTNITFKLANASKVKLTVNNNIGQKVSTLVNQKMTAGSHSVTFDASDLPSGVYIYRLKADGYSESRKMLLVK